MILEDRIRTILPLYLVRIQVFIHITTILIQSAAQPAPRQRKWKSARLTPEEREK
jgi:hypothetical protein